MAPYHAIRIYQGRRTTMYRPSFLVPLRDKEHGTPVECGTENDPEANPQGSRVHARGLTQRTSDRIDHVNDRGRRRAGVIIGA